MTLTIDGILFTGANVSYRQAKIETNSSWAADARTLRQKGAK